MASLDRINKVFNESQYFVKELTGLELSLSEKIELRRYAKLCAEIYEKETSMFHKINPDVESALMFLNKNYGTQIYNIEDFQKFNAQMNEDEKRYNIKYSDFFKKMQEEQFLP